MSKKIHNDSDDSFRFWDFLVILLCLSGAVFLVNLFRLDLFSTLDSKNEKPVGTIVIKNNIVQRRMANRILWDRLVVDSPAYMGDLIRTADLSDAMLRIENNGIDLYENTLIRIQRSPDGSVQIDLNEGNLVLSAGSGGGNIVLSVMGHQVHPAPGTILNASMGSDGLEVKVSEGTAIFIDDAGQMREIPFGSMLALDASGAQRLAKAAVGIQPRPNARYLKNKPELMQINFAWNRINLDSGEPLRLEIAEDRDFNRIVRVIDNLNTAAEVPLDAGNWYWRLSSGENNASRNVLSTERFSVTEAAGPVLLSPVTNTLFRYHNDLPQLRFQWSEIEEASSYILQASETPSFINLRLSMQTTSVFLLNSGFEQGTWYWRVLPVFHSIYEGSAAFSSAASFRIEPGAAGEAALVLPEPVIEQREQRLPEGVPVRITLLSPASGTSLPGLTALRQQTVFSWSSDGEIESSRFILSRNSNPLQGRPAVELVNPGRTIRLNRLEAGTYYWTVEVQSAEGLISSAQPRQLRILPIPLLPAPENLQPPGGYRIGIEQLMESDSIVFSWSAVRGANAYILTLYEDTANGRRQVIRVPPETRTTWTLESLAVLGRGTFVWQVEAVNRNSAGVIEERSRIGESTFIIDIPRPGQLQAEDPGTLYGF
jgi:hypothetical protein